MARPLVLVVERNTAVRAALERIIQEIGGEYRGAADPDGAHRILDTEPVQVVLVDAGLKPETLKKFLTCIGKHCPGAVAVGLGLGLGDPGAGGLLKAGLFDLAPGPGEPGHIALVLERALDQVRIQNAYRRLRNGVRGRSGFQHMVGPSAFMDNLRGKLERSAPGNGSVLFYGPAGSGRERAARYMHSISERREQPFHMLDCSSFPADALGAELFGQAGNTGLLAMAADGSVFLEEVGRLPGPIQSRLVETLAAGRTGCRVLASSSLDLPLTVRDGAFLEDLLDRLARTTVILEPLSRRMEDIPVLANHFLDTICQINELPPIRLSAAVLEVLGRYHWPGNIRELRNAMEQAAILASGTVQPEDLPARIREQVRSDAPDGEPVALEPFRDGKKKVVDAFEERYLSELLLRKRGNVTAAAEQAGMLRSALQRLLRKHRIRSSEYRGIRSGRTAAAPERKLPVD